MATEKIMTHFTITKPEAGQRLDKFLNTQLPQSSRSQLQKRIKSGRVTVNGLIPTVHQFLKVGDRVAIDDVIVSARKPSELPTQPLPIPDIPIVKDTTEYLIINKPAGVLVHDAPGKHEATVVDFVLRHYPDVAKIGEDPVRPGIVHRIDKDVSGLLVIAKTQDMFDHLKTQFKTRRVEKWYYALVYGRPQQPNGEIKFNIDRSSTADHKMAAVPSQERDRGKPALTEFEIIEPLGSYTLLRVRPRTGRTHQIRVHLNAYGLPIVGDQLYHPKKMKSSLTLDRIFLHAYHLAFPLPDGSRLMVECELPKKLAEILDSIR